MLWPTVALSQMYHQGLKDQMGDISPRGPGSGADRTDLFTEPILQKKGNR